VRVGGGLIGIEADGVMLDERSRREIDVQVRVRDQRIDHGQRELRLVLNERGQGDAGGCTHPCLHLRDQRQRENGAIAIVIQNNTFSTLVPGQR